MSGVVLRLYEKTIGRWLQTIRDLSFGLVTHTPGPTGLRWRFRYYRRQGARLAQGIELHPGVVLLSSPRCEIGERSILYAGVTVAVEPGGWFKLGAHSHLSGGCYVLAGSSTVSIGCGTAIGPHCILAAQSNLANSEQPVVETTISGPVSIGDDVFLGAGVTVLPGVTIGDHAVCAAGAVVTQDVLPWHVVGGVPARTLKLRNEEAQHA